MKLLHGMPMRRFLALAIIMLPAIIMDFYIDRFDLQWLSTGILEIEFESLGGAGVYILITGILKLLILGMMYWYFFYILFLIPYFLITRKIPGFPKI